jgi:hypothetical protein
MIRYIIEIFAYCRPKQKMELIGTERKPTRILDGVEKGSYNDTAKRCFHKQCVENSNTRLCREYNSY